MKYLLIAIALLVSACNFKTLEYGQFGDTTCTTEQWEKAVKEAKDSIEINNMGPSKKVYSMWLLEAAVARNCERKKP